MGRGKLAFRLRWPFRRGGGFRRLRCLPLNLPDETIAAPGESFDKSRAAGRIAQHFTDLVHSRIQTVVKIDEGIGGPQLFAQLLASNNAPGPFQKKNEKGKRLVLKPKPAALL